MDPLWIGGLLLAVLVLVLVLAYLLLYNEQSFEDAVASQRASSDILMPSKSSSVKAALRNRKKPKKERIKSDGENVSEKNTKISDVPPLDASEDSDPTILPDSLADDAVALFEAIPEKPNIVESSEEEKPSQKPKRKTKDKRKSERRNIDSSSPPKEQELVREEVLVQESVVKTNSEPTLEGLPPLIDDEALFPKEEQPLPTANSGKKSKKSKAPKDKYSTAEPLDYKSLVEALEMSTLSHSDIQKLVDVLLDKQKSAEQWRKSGGKPDPVDVLRKQLNDKEEAFKEEHSRAESLAIKIKELREELVQEKTKQRSVEESAAQKIKTLEKENEALQMRMTATHKNNAIEHEKLVAALENSKQTHGHVQTDWHQFPQAKEFIQHSESQKAELEKRISALEADLDARKESESILVQQAADANDRVKSFDAVKNSLTQQLMETVKSKSDSEQRLELLKKDAESAHAEKTSAVQQAEAVQVQLDEERAKKSEFEKMLKAMEVKFKDASDKHEQEKETLARQLADGKKDDVQIAELQKQSDDASRQLDELKAKLVEAEEEHGKTKQSLASRDEQLNKHQEEISNLNSLNVGKDEEIDLLRKTVSQHESEIVVMKNMTQELQSAPPEVDDSKIKMLEEENEKLNEKLNEKKEQIAAWEKSIESMKTKNNDLREKNWKAMDALSAAEKQHKIEIGKAVASVKEENKKNLAGFHADVKEFLCRIQPTLSIDKSLSYEKFLQEYENETADLGCKSPTSESDDSKLEELKEQLKDYLEKNEQLAAQCAEYKTTLDSKDNELNDLLRKNEEFDSQCNKYKTLLGSTENMLHELEDNVESEMANLKVTVENKDAEIEKTNSSLRELDEKLQKALDDAKSKDEQIASLEQELSNKANLADKESELQKMAATVAELKANSKKTDEDAKMKELDFKTLQNEMSSKESELQKTNSSLRELEEKLQKALDDAKSKDERIASLEQELSNKANLADKESELQKMAATVAEFKANLKKTDEDAKIKEVEFQTLQNEMSSKESELQKVNATVAELKEKEQKANDESKSKDSKINSLQLELSTLKKAAATSSDVSKNELKKASDEIERLKGEEKRLRDELDAAKNEAKQRAEEDKSPETEKYKNEASDAAKVNAALRKELEEVRIQAGETKSSSKKQDKDSEAKVKVLEEKLALASKKESELQAKIAHLEDSTSTASLDEDAASPDSKDKKKKRGFSLMGSKSNKYETKYRDVSEKYEQLKSESDGKTSKIAELEAKLQKSEKALETQEQKVKELSDNLQKAQSAGLSNGGVQSTSQPLNESQVKQMAEAMNDGDPTGAV